MKLYYNWVNEPQVRKNSCDNKKHISWHSHKNWFRKKIQDKSSTLYVFEKKHKNSKEVYLDSYLKRFMVRNIDETFLNL